MQGTGLYSGSLISITQAACTWQDTGAVPGRCWGKHLASTLLEQALPRLSVQAADTAMP